MADTVHEFVEYKDDATRRVKALVGNILLSEDLSAIEKSVMMLTVMGRGVTEIASDYGVTYQYIQAVRSRAWKKIYEHVPGAIERPNWQGAIAHFSAERRRIERE